MLRLHRRGIPRMQFARTCQLDSTSMCIGMHLPCKKNISKTEEYKKGSKNVLDYIIILSFDIGLLSRLTWIGYKPFRAFRKCYSVCFCVDNPFQRRYDVKTILKSIQCSILKILTPMCSVS